MKIITILMLACIPLLSLSQKDCKCDADKIAGWKYRDKGLNEEILNGQTEFQHPVTTFYRWSENS